METERQPFGRGCPVITADGALVTLTGGPSSGWAPKWTGIGRGGRSVTVFDHDIAGPVRNCMPRLVFSDESAAAQA